MITICLLVINNIIYTRGAQPKFPTTTPDNTSTKTPFKEENAYKKYAHYPKYCSTPEEMETRSVPPLQTGSANDGTSKLIHVTALIRHGARTPFTGAPSYQCWNGYWANPETGVWNCDLKTYISPPAATKDKGQVVIDSQGIVEEEEPDFLFEKRYDALKIPPNKTGNNLNGTCQLGQLLTKGYDQELRNGLHLRQAYFYDNNTTDEHAAKDSRMRLWDLSATNNGGSEGIGDHTKPIFEQPNLRYRVDDEQRTLMSGQVLLRGLFEQELLAVNDDETAVIPLHTADYHLDVLGINEKVCPRTDDVRKQAYASDEYKKWINSKEVKAVKSFLKDKLDMDEIPYSMLDCLMTTICTDRTLPSQLNDYDGSLGPTSWSEGMTSLADNGDSTVMFERIANFATKNYTFAYKYNDAAWAKLGMGPLWKEILDNILPIVAATNRAGGSHPPKLALFSGHDTTLMPILATLGDNVWEGTEWAPYASMIQIEVHKILKSDKNYPSGFAFRLIYNGKVLTAKMDKCKAELCDIQVLIKQVMPFAKYKERNCESSITPPGDDLMSEMKTASDNLIHAPGGMVVVLLLVILGLTLGAVLMWMIMKRKMRRYAEYRRESTVLGDLSMKNVTDDPHLANESNFQEGVDTWPPHGDVKKFDLDEHENSLI